MSKFVLGCVVFSCATMVALMLAVTAVQAQPASEAARLDCFVHPDGNTYFALSLPPVAAAATSGPRDVVILVSTSASQEGDYRSKAFEALQAAVAGLGRGDRVRLIATDLNAIPLSKGFVSPQSGEWTAGAGGVECADAVGLQ